MKTLLALVLAASPAFAAPQPVQEASVGRRYVSADIRGSFRDRWDISDNQGKLWMNVSVFGNSVSFSGRPISGSLWGSGNYFSLSGGSVSGHISKFGNGLSVSATVFGPRGTRYINFHMYANGSMDDPRWTPSLNLFSADANLDFSPSFNRDYRVSGSIDEERFGDEGLAVACLAATMVLKDRPQSKAVPGKDFLQKSAVVAPFLKTGFGR